MTCKLERPDPQMLFNRIRDMFSVNVLGGAPVIQESNEWYVVSNDYAMAEMFYAFADQMAQDLDPATACCESLVTMASRNGVYPRPATFAEGYARLTGTPGANLPPSIEIVTSIGNYRSTGSVPLEIGGDGAAVVRIRSIVPGPQNNSAGEIKTGTIVSPITDVDREVEICGGNICSGADAETCEQFRTRYLNRLAYKPRATQSWIQEKLLEWPCATRVMQRAGSCCECDDCADCDGCATCGSKMEYYVMFDGSFPCGIPPQSLTDDITSWMFGKRQGYGEGQVEVGICGGVFTSTGILFDLEIDVDGCPSAAQLRTAEANVRDLFATVAPSEEISAQQIRLVIAEAVGAQNDIDIRFVTDSPEEAEMIGAQDCCGLAPKCDVLPCLRNVIFTNAGISSGCN